MYIARLKRNCSLLDLPIAHKGAFGETENGHIVENTIDSIKACIDKNIPFEIDIVNTQDNIPIIYHDFTITLDKDVFRISELTYDELKRFTINMPKISTLKEYN